MLRTLLRIGMSLIILAYVAGPTEARAATNTMCGICTEGFMCPLYGRAEACQALCGQAWANDYCDLGIADCYEVGGTIGWTCTDD